MTYRVDGKAQTATLGPYPLLSLADARTKRDDLRRQLLDGVDLKAKPKKSITLSAAIAAYWGGRQDISPGYLANICPPLIRRYVSLIACAICIGLLASTIASYASSACGTSSSPCASNPSANPRR